MKSYFKYIYFPFLFFAVIAVNGQDYKLLGDNETETIKFEMINNLIILPVEVNGVELTFIVDSGVGTPVIFNLKSSDSLEIMDVKNIRIRGLGKGDSVDAFQSKGRPSRDAQPGGKGEKFPRHGESLVRDAAAPPWRLFPGSGPLAR